MAHYTTPTNIGLYLISTLSAYDLGYIGLLELAVRLRSTFESMDELEHYRGHLLNWYDSQTLTALPPRYVSTVDSGNLAACLITLKQGCLSLTDAPFLDDKRWQGLLVILDILMETLQKLEGKKANASDADTIPVPAQDIEALEFTLAGIYKRISAIQNEPEAWIRTLVWLSGEEWEQVSHRLMGVINYTPFGHSDWQSIVAEIKNFGSTGKKTAVVSTINGDANVPFYKELGNQGISAEAIQVVAFSVGEEELSGIDTKPLVGHLAAWDYFMSVDKPANAAFIKECHGYIKNPKRVTNDPMEAHYIGFNLWVKAVEKAGTTDTDKVIAAMIGLEVPNLTGGTAKLLSNHHITKPVLIGEIQDDGQFQVVWKTEKEVPGDAWSDYLPGSKDITADWTPPISFGNYNTKTKTCSGQNY